MHLPRVPRGFILATMLLIGHTVWGATATWAQALSRPLPGKITLFARVIAPQPSHLTAGLAGRLVDFDVRPGDRVRPGEKIGRIGGPAVTARLQAAQRRIRADQVAVHSAAALLRITRRQKQRQLATGADLLRAEDALSTASSRLALDRAARLGLVDGSRLSVPFVGTVTALRAAAGDYVQPGQVVLDLAPTRGLLLSARVYGARAGRVKPGEGGRFQADGGSSALAVKVVSKAPAPDSPGVRVLYLAPTHPTPGWALGDAGTLTLSGPSRALPSIPDGALVMDQGQWWVMLKTAHGERPVVVTPVARDQGRAWIGRGLRAGQTVRLKGAYQAFHRDFARQYANPD